MEIPDIDAYIKEAEKIERMYMDLLEGTTQKRMKRIDDGSTGLQNVKYSVCVINSGNKLLQSMILEIYNAWYEDCHELIRKYSVKGMSAKIGDFVELHENIISLINLKDSIRKSSERNHLRKEFIASLDAQVNVLHTVRQIVSSGRNDRMRMLTANMLISGLEEAENLCERGQILQAGSLAGLVLERYLRALCEKNGLQAGPDATMVAMAHDIHESNLVYEFDSQMLRTIVDLAVIISNCAETSNCADLNEEVHAYEVREMIDKVRELIFLAFY
ncbi:hypothetical protein [Methanolobus sp. WCC5]|uniref:hypothetical protein n=1 Tax=Methanolobus sp. WCC5 TaxID=3125785 RepID=UPI00324D4E0A